MIGRRSGLPKRPYEKGIGWEFVDLAVFPAKDIVGQVGDMELDTQRGVFSLVWIGCSCVPGGLWWTLEEESRWAIFGGEGPDSLVRWDTETDGRTKAACVLAVQ